MKTLFRTLTALFIPLLLLVACNRDVAVTGISLSQASIELTQNQTFQLIATVQPSDATNREVSWQSSNTTVATVSDDGLVEAHSVGQATIIAITRDGDKTATCAVIVRPAGVTGVVLSQRTAQLGGNETLALTATVIPENATNQNVTWRSTSPSVATVNNNGLVTTTMAGGEVMIIVTTEDGQVSDTCRITVTIAVEGVVLNYNEANVGLNDDLVLRAEVLPATAANRNVTWQSSNPAVATVNSDGVVRGLTLGTTTITVTTVDGGKTDRSTVTVVVPVANCNNNTPGWGANGLGTVSFISSNTWEFAGLRWSDDVVASNCEKTTININQNSNFAADCRSNPEGGTFFSWCAIARFQDEICPEGWRVPTSAEFLALDLEIGEVGALKLNRYVNDWGARLSGWVRFNGDLMNVGTMAYYWSQTPSGNNNAFALSLTAPGTVNAQFSLIRNAAGSLRCVQDL